jgi:hypothetical protein
VHYAKLEFPDGPGGPVGVTPHEVNVEVERLNPAIDRVEPAASTWERSASHAIRTTWPGAMRTAARCT